MRFKENRLSFAKGQQEPAGSSEGCGAGDRPSRVAGREESAGSPSIIHHGVSVTPESTGHLSKLTETERSMKMTSGHKLSPAA